MLKRVLSRLLARPRRSPAATIRTVTGTATGRRLRPTRPGRSKPSRRPNRTPRNVAGWKKRSRKSRTCACAVNAEGGGSTAPAWAASERRRHVIFGDVASPGIAEFHGVYSLFRGGMPSLASRRYKQKGGANMGNATAILRGPRVSLKWECATTYSAKDSKKHNSALSAGPSIRPVGQQLAGLGVAGIAGLGGLSLHFADAAVDAGNLSLRTGVALDEIQRLPGPSAASKYWIMCSTICPRLSTPPRRAAAKRRTPCASTHFMQELSKLRPDEQFKLLATAISKAGAAQASLTKDTLGKGGLELLPLLKKARRASKSWKSDFKENHAIFTPEDVATSKEFKLTMSALTGNLDASVLP